MAGRPPGAHAIHQTVRAIAKHHADRHNRVASRRSSERTRSGQRRPLANYFTPEELAAQLYVSLRTLNRWHARRQGPPRLIIGRKPY
jgi:hypothetical protein